MIASFKCLLPFTLQIAEGQLPPLASEADGCEYEVSAPYQCSVRPSDIGYASSTPMVAIVDKLGRAEKPVVLEGMLINGKSTIDANAIQINFRKESFDRTISAGQMSSMDPSLDYVFNILNNFLEVLREVTKAAFIRALLPQSTIWRIDYFGDYGAILPPEKGKLGGHMVTGFQMKYCVLTEEIWTSITKIPPDREAPVWEGLFLDALDALPNTGLAIVLAFSAIEILATQIVDFHARQKVKPEGLWDWINDRKQYWREPSVADKLDRLLLDLAGDSLKNDSTKWQHFTRLKDARNNFVHSGYVLINEKPPSNEEIAALIVNTKETLDWLAKFLPEKKKPFMTDYRVEVEFRKKLR